MAAYHQSEPDDLTREGHPEPEGRHRSGAPPGRNPPPQESSAEGDPDLSCQFSARDIAVLLGYSHLDGCPSLAGLNAILENDDNASEEELSHIAVCPDCVPRVRALRAERRAEATEFFEACVDLIRDSNVSASPVVQEAEGHARLLFLMIGQDTYPQQWKEEAWSCTRKIAMALRIARTKGGANNAEMETIIELFMTAIGTAASNPVATCSRSTDGAWPIVEMVKQTAIDIALSDPSLFKAFSRSLGYVVHIVNRRMKAMLAYAMVDLFEHGILPDVFAPLLIREISSSDLSDAVRVVLATMLHAHRRLPLDVRSGVADAWCDPRIDEVYLSVARGKHAIDTALQASRTSPAQSTAFVVSILSRFVDDLSQASEAEDAMLRLIALRQLVRDMPDDAEVPLQSIAEQLFDITAHAVRPTFFAIEIASVIRDRCPAALTTLVERITVAGFMMRQGIINVIADGYAAAFRGFAQTAVPGFVRCGPYWEFYPGATAHPLDASCHRIALGATGDFGVHLLWFKHRLAPWTAKAETVMSTI